MQLEKINELNTYTTQPDNSTFFSRTFPSFSHYLRIVHIVVSAGRLAGNGQYPWEEWVKSSQNTMRSLEKAGTKIFVEGIEHFRNIEGPCVFIGNHMSVFETFALPCLIQPIKDVTFVVKDSLLKYPYFGKVLASRNPIVVGRVNPREDLTTMLREGEARLKAGRSIIVFPQSTRSACFDLGAFNSIGIKLARRTGVPVVPVAIKSDAWGMGRMLKDFGVVIPEKDVHIKFGPALTVEGNGKAEHAAVCEFISKNLGAWGIKTIEAIAPSQTKALAAGTEA